MKENIRWFEPEEITGRALPVEAVVRYYIKCRRVCYTPLKYVRSYIKSCNWPGSERGQGGGCPLPVETRVAATHFLGRWRLLLGSWLGTTWLGAGTKQVAAAQQLPFATLGNCLLHLWLRPGLLRGSDQIQQKKVRTLC